MGFANKRSQVLPVRNDRESISDLKTYITDGTVPVGCRVVTSRD